MLGSLVPWRTRFPATFRRMERDMEDLMNRFFRDEEFWPTPAAEFAPSADLAETDKGYEVTMDLPGIEAEDLTVEIRDGSLMVSGERKEEKEEKGKTFHRMERHYGAFHRLIPLDLPVDPEKVEATYHDGVLRISVAKTPGVQPKRIAVKS